MKVTLIALVALPFIGGIASAADRLTDLQLDTVTAGFTLTLPTIDCAVCVLASSTSISNNGVTTSTSNVTGPTPPASGNSGGSGGSGGTGNGGGGGTGSGNGSGGSNGATTVVNPVVTPGLNATLAAILNSIPHE